MTVLGDLSVADYAQFTGSTGLLDVKGTFTQAGGRFTAPSSMKVAGSWVGSPIAEFANSGGIVEFYGGNKHSFVSGGAAFANIVQSGAGLLQLGDSLTVAESLSIGNGLGSN